MVFIYRNVKGLSVALSHHFSLLFPIYAHSNRHSLQVTVLCCGCDLFLTPFLIFLSFFRHSPHLVLVLTLIISRIFKAYPVINDTAIILPFIPTFFSALYPHMDHALIFVFTNALALLSLPITWYWWIYQGSGNANFYFGATLTGNISMGIMAIMIMRAQLFFEITRDNKDVDIVKLIRE